MVTGCVSPGRLADLSAGAVIGIISARVVINPLELVDLGLGFVGLDIGGDDPEPKGTTKESASE